MDQSQWSVQRGSILHNKCKGKKKDGQQSLLHWGTQGHLSGPILPDSTGKHSALSCAIVYNHYGTQMSQNWRSRSCRGGDRDKNKQLKILQVIYMIKQILYMKPHWSWMLLSFDRSNRAENGRWGERGGVCAWEWSPECHWAAHQLPLNIPISTSAWNSIWN